MATTTETIEILNDLVAINHDRIKGYEYTLKEIPDDDGLMKKYFLNLIKQSHTIRVQLSEEVKALGGKMEKVTVGTGKIYRAWSSVIGVFTIESKQSLLRNCERIENAIQHVYNQALSSEGLPTYLRKLIMQEQEGLQTAHDKIKNMCEAGA